MTVANNTDNVDQQEFLNSVSESFLTWTFSSLLPRLLLGLFLLLMIVGVVTNTMLVGVAISSKLLKHPVHTFVLQLGILDLVAVVSVVLPIVINVSRVEISGSKALGDNSDQTSTGFCKLHTILFNWFLLVNFALHDVMIIERALHAVAADGSKYHLQTFGNNCFVRLLSAGIWTIFLLVALLLTLSNADDVVYRGTQFQCALDFDKHPSTMHALFSLTMYISLAVFLISLFIILYTRRKVIRIQQNSLNAHETPKQNKSESDARPSTGTSLRNPDNLNPTTLGTRDCTGEVLKLKNFTVEKTNTVLKRSFQQYSVSQHTEKTRDTQTSVFHVDKVSPDILLRPIIKPLHRSNVRVGVTPDIERNETQIVHQNTTNASEFSTVEDQGSVEFKKAPRKATLNRETAPKQKMALPQFKSKQLWIKTRGVLAVRDTPLSLFRDVPHDVHHHQSMTYLISWSVTYILWVVYVIAAYTEVYGAVSCQVCYRVGVLLGLASYSTRPLVLVGHNRWYRDHCRQEVKKLVKCVRSCCPC